jgi:hypothetical protein
MNKDAPDTVKYAAVLDGHLESADVRATLAEAEADARWLRAHPARRDRVAFGHGGRVQIVRVVQDEWTGETIERPV